MKQAATVILSARPSLSALNLAMDRLQKLLSNQYYVVFDAVPGKGWLAARQSPNGASQFSDSGA
jgi:hypothetical protein